MTDNSITGMLPKEKMCSSAVKLRDTYSIKPGAPLFQKEFGFYCLEQWEKAGIPRERLYSQESKRKLFGYDEPGNFSLNGLGWTKPEFYPLFEEKIVEDRGEYEVVQDISGRLVLYFKQKRSGFMPEYLDDRHVDYILPAMKERGGYIPTCDHGVPAEVSFENYMCFRKRCLEFA